MSGYDPQETLMDRLTQPPEEDPEETSEEEEGSGEDPNKPIMDKLQELEERQPDAQSQQLLQDPEVRKIVEARQQGKNIRTLTDEEVEQMAGSQTTTNNNEVQSSTSEEPDLSNMSFEDMTPQQLIRYAQQATEQRVVQQVQKVLDEKLQPVTEKVESVEEETKRRQREEFQQQIEAVRKQYPDFDNHREEMVKISNQNPGLSVEEVYLTAKRRAGERVETEGSTESEKPTHSSAKPPRGSSRSVKGNRREKAPRTRRGFDSLLSDHLSKKDFSKPPEERGAE